jgi:amidase
MNSSDLTSQALEKISSIDQSGYELRSVLAVAPDAMDQARRLDQNYTDLPLGGLPILIKDNIEALGLPASAGTLALSNTPVIRDSSVAQRLRAAGAVIVGATNLSEWANIRSTKSTSGWSSVGGLTANPWKHAHSAGGSSSGSGAAVAAGITQWAVGSETDGSIICPASLNGCVGIKPTVGSIPRDAMIPISPSQDTPGPMAQTVAQAAVLLDVLTNQRQYARAAMHDGELRIGVVNSWMTENDGVNGLCEDAVTALAKAGVVLTRVELSPPTEEVQNDELHVLMHEMNTAIEKYLGERAGTNIKSMADIVAFNNKHRETEMAHFGQELFELALEIGGIGAEYEAERARNLAWANHTLDTGLADVDVLIGCTYGPAWVSTLGSGDDFGSASWITTAPAIAGTPIGTIPMGLVGGLPVGLGFVSRRNDEARLIHAMAKAESALGLGILNPTFSK